MEKSKVKKKEVQTEDKYIVTIRDDELDGLKDKQKREADSAGLEGVVKSHLAYIDQLIETLKGRLKLVELAVKSDKERKKSVTRKNSGTEKTGSRAGN